MSYVSVKGISKSFSGRPPVQVFDQLSFEIEQGEFIVLLGPSGCGKTTTLRCLAGLDEPDRGRISLGGDTVFDGSAKVDLPAHKRNIGMVFQSYALWPHMTVRQNIAYPLRARRLKQLIGAGRVEEVAAQVSLAPELLDRYPANLSGGQQQRVALARGLVAEPDLILFDEPLSNLDTQLRDAVRTQLHELHAKLGFTAVFVTHDQSEALALGDRLAIMRSGLIEQFDTPSRIFENPATEYVAEFLGMSNVLTCQRRPDGWYAEGVRAEGDATLMFRGDITSGRVRVRPDDVDVRPASEPPPAGRIALSGTVQTVEYAGRHLDVTVRIGEGRVRGRLDVASLDGWGRGLEAGQPVSVQFRSADAPAFGDSNRPPSPGPTGVEPMQARVAP